MEMFLAVSDGRRAEVNQHCIFSYTRCWKQTHISYALLNWANHKTTQLLFSLPSQQPTAKVNYKTLKQPSQGSMSDLMHFASTI